MDLRMIYTIKSMDEQEQTTVSFSAYFISNSSVILPKFRREIRKVRKEGWNSK